MLHVIPTKEGSLLRSKAVRMLSRNDKLPLMPPCRVADSFVGMTIEA